MTAEPTIRRLAPTDADALFALRQEALRDAPLAFLSSPATDPDTARTDTLAQLNHGATNVVFGALAPRLLAMVGLYQDGHAKAIHKAHIWGAYVTPAARGRGLGRAVMRAAIDHAATLPGVTQLHIGVTETATTAHNLYESLGFVTWGTEPNAIRHAGTCVDERHMVLHL